MDAQRRDICRVSVEYRSMCRSSAGRVSTDISTDTGPILDRHSANIRSTLGRCVDRVSTATRPTYRPSVDRWCRPTVSTDTTYSKHDPAYQLVHTNCPLSHLVQQLIETSGHRVRFVHYMLVVSWATNWADCPMHKPPQQFLRAAPFSLTG